MNNLPSEHIIYTENLSKQFNGVSAVKELSLQIPPGVIFGFIGPSGCGKTTSVRLLLGVYKPDSGDIQVLGHRPGKFSHRVYITSLVLSSPADNETAIAQGETTAAEIEASLEEADRLLFEFRDIDSNILVSPFKSDSISVTEANLEPMHFYVPGVIALLLQHLAITLAGLSIVREKLEGAMELFRAGPVSALEILVGKYSSYIMIIALTDAKAANQPGSQ